MLDPKADGRLQLTAALALLATSRLVLWVPDALAFCPVERDDFEAHWRKEVHPVFGRLICWITFSAGAELLAKGVCLSSGIEVRDPHTVPTHPQGDLDAWAHAFLRNQQTAGSVSVPDFGTLGELLSGKPSRNGRPARPPPLKDLCRMHHASPQMQERVFAAYTLLIRSIRNRDAHAYIPNVRDQHFSLVPTLFTGVFNLLISWIDGGPKRLHEWQESAGHFIRMLQRPTDMASDDDELLALTEHLRAMNGHASVKTLSLRKGVTDAGLRNLKEFVALDTLNLDSSAITDAGLKETTHLKNLLQLRIFSAPITDAGLQILAQMQTLNRLSLAGTNVTAKGIERLQRARPRLTIRF